MRINVTGGRIGVVECLDDREIKLVESQTARRSFKREVFGLAYHQYKPERVSNETSDTPFQSEMLKGAQSGQMIAPKSRFR